MSRTTGTGDSRCAPSAGGRTALDLWNSTETESMQPELDIGQLGRMCRLTMRAGAAGCRFKSGG